MTDGEKQESVTQLEFYRQGSECCRNYSELTMKVRTLAQQVMLAYALGMGLVLTKGGQIGVLLFGGGIILILFATALWILNQHYSLSFTRIRDSCLRTLEKELVDSPEIRGPWEAHAQGQSAWVRVAAWHWPYIVLVIVGFLTMLMGVAWGFFDIS